MITHLSLNTQYTIDSTHPLVILAPSLRMSTRLLVMFPILIPHCFSWSETNVTTYRPTNEGCLMRIVTTPNFCQVCVEGLWLELLKRVDLIDSVSLGCSFDTPTTVQRIIEIRLLALAQFREVRTTHKEAYEIIWRRNGAPLPEFTNQTSVYIENTLAILTVDVRFITDEVRIDPHKYLTTSAEIEVSTCTIGSK